MAISIFMSIQSLSKSFARSISQGASELKFGAKTIFRAARSTGRALQDLFVRLGAGASESRPADSGVVGQVPDPKGTIFGRKELAAVRPPAWRPSESPFARNFSGLAMSLPSMAAHREAVATEVTGPLPTLHAVTLTDESHWAPRGTTIQTINEPFVPGASLTNDQAELAPPVRFDMSAAARVQAIKFEGKQELARASLKIQSTSLVE